MGQEVQELGLLFKIGVVVSLGFAKNREFWV